MTGRITVALFDAVRQFGQRCREMFRTKTLFVVGAGASTEVGFPTGSDLLEGIAGALNISTDYGERATGHPAIRTAIGMNGGYINPGTPTARLVAAAQRIRGAAQLGLSIDNVIYQNDDDPGVPLVGKLAIACSILEVERKSALYVSPQGLTLGSIRGSWLHRFAQLLVQDVPRSGLDRIFDNISIVNFNYDRSIQQFLPRALVGQYGLEFEQACSLAATLKIYHPYGSLGPLPYQSQHSNVEYGGGLDRLSAVATNIKTFTEQVTDDDALDAARQAIGAAERIVFLGFGYHRQNMELLAQKEGGSAHHVYGTSFGLSTSDAAIVGAQLGAFHKPAFRGYVDPILQPLKCVEFIDQNFRTFVS